jgi:Uri superfamily endonuclease
VEIWFSYDPCIREHQWSEILRSIRGASMPLPGFGASDCGCPSHLFRLRRHPAVRTFRKKLRNRFKQHMPVHQVRFDCGNA